MTDNLIDCEGETNSVFNEIRELVVNGRNRVYSVFNTEMLQLYWEDYNEYSRWQRTCIVW